MENSHGMECRGYNQSIEGRIMATALTSNHWSDEQLLSLPDYEGKVELVDGRLVMMAPAGSEHGDIGAFIIYRLMQHVIPRKLGRVFNSETGYRLQSGNLRAPDVSFVAAVRLKGMNRLPRGFLKGSPDLAVEILSPNDSVGATDERLEELFENDTRLAWLINPSQKTVAIYRNGRLINELHIGDAIDGEDILPGFSLPLSEIFADLNFE